MRALTLKSQDLGHEDGQVQELQVEGLICSACKLGLGRLLCAKLCFEP